MPKLLNPNLAKIHRNYTVEEIASLYGIHRGTVRNWLNNGLSACDTRRPVLILGSVLREYLQSKRTGRKRKCKPDELYCMRCREPRQPAGMMLDYEPISETKGRLTGLCPECGCLMNRFTSKNKFRHIQQHFDVSIPMKLEHLGDSSHPLVNSDLKIGA